MNNLDKISNYYDNLVLKYGYNPRACDYGSPHSQRVKFKVMSEATIYDNKSILDIGCGFADFGVFLKNLYNNVKYEGVDISNEMIIKAQQLHPELKVYLKNVFDEPPIQKYDIVTSNGIFYLLGDNAKNIMENFIKKMFDYANEVVAFNSLSTHAKDQEDGEFYADPIETLKYCQSITPWVVLRQDYHSRDFTIYMYKKPQNNYDSSH
ncbi:MAG: class I SAM-dependent methyltransferase [Thermonemataceae bacterium]|nr:class I SAM-dependent methyltransferase [Thermonemataceae bacterium]